MQDVLKRVAWHKVGAGISRSHRGSTEMHGVEHLRHQHVGGPQGCVHLPQAVCGRAAEASLDDGLARP